MRLNQMDALTASAAIRSGKITSEELVRACLERIAETEERIHAWIHLEPEYALKQAREADRRQSSGMALGPLHGIPVGIKDIFDTADMPTENGTVLHAGRKPDEDATAVALLRRAGAVIMGKTVTTELAVYAPGKTTNPHDPQRTPGGSSSGSAAAVAACMVPLALGTQTNGSVLRPASYCGVYGYKPSHGLISRHGVLKQSRILDQVGVFARTIGDAALIARQLVGWDGKDPDVQRQARLDLNEGLIIDSNMRPRVAFVKTPIWEKATDITKAAFAKLNERWGDWVCEVELPKVFASAVEWHRTIMESDLAISYAAEYAAGKDRLSDTLREMIERGQRYSSQDYSKACEGIAALTAELDKIFSDHDVILTPAATGEAPMGLDYTGSPIFCTIWTLCGVPAISLPILKGQDRMPIGAQLVASKGDDHRLLKVAQWLVDKEKTQ